MSLAASGYAILSTATTVDIVDGHLHIIKVAMPAELRAQDDPRVIKAEQLVAQLRGEIQ
jgi:hypothetical protein